jgi:hypothetical protein
VARIAARSAVLLALIVSSWTAASVAAGPFAPLSSLGKLRPAPDPGTPGAEGFPIPDAPPLAPASSVPRRTKTVDGIRCQSNERLRSHVHTHLALFVGGKPRKLPAGIGIWPRLPAEEVEAGQFFVTPKYCFSWLSTHFADGIVHTEAPVARSFVLGELFDVWGQALGRNRVGPAHGKVTAIVDGRVWTGDPRMIPLVSHARIQLEVGRPLVAPQPVDWPGTF